MGKCAKKTGRAKKKVTRAERRNVIKGPKTAWIFFYIHMAKENPQRNFKDSCTALSPQWRQMSEEEKAPYEAMAAEDMRRYRAQRAALTDEQKSIMRRYRKQKRLKNRGAPKRPMSDYLYFSVRNRARIQAENPQAAFKDVARITGRQWAALSADERRPYVELHRSDLARYVGEKAALQSKRQVAPGK